MKVVAIWVLEHWHYVAYIVLVIMLLVKYVRHSWREKFGERRSRPHYETSVLIVLIFVAVIAGRIEQLGSELTARFADVIALERETELSRVKRMRERLEPNFDAAFGDYITASIENVVTAVEVRTIVISDDEFPALYKRTLARFGKSEFFATSIPSKSYFWRDPSVDEAITKFIRGGGRMRRIFFVTDIDLERASEEWSIVARHEAMGVEVYVADIDDVPIEMYKLFMVEGDQRFAWEADIGVKTEITRVVCTSSPEAVAKYHDIWKQLVRLEIAKRFTSKAD
jgi:hypothetical protein